MNSSIRLYSVTTAPLPHENDSLYIKTFKIIKNLKRLINTSLPGPAVHITNLIPSSTSLLTPSPLTVQAILTRASLPIEILALAACMLDSLNSRFALTWRLGCPFNTPSSSHPQEPHIDNVRPEVIALAAVILSAQFLDDLSSSGTRAYARDWGRGVWSSKQVNFTQRCLLENIGYSLLPLCDEGIIRDAIRDMERAARRSDVVLYSSSAEGKLRVDAKGAAVAGDGEQLTPAETPTMEKACSPFAVPPDRFTRSWGAYPEISDSCG